MPEPDFTHRFAELGAGHPLPATVNLTIGAPAGPAVPTEFMEIDGIRLAPAARLMALARIRDAHRSVSRAANDRMHSAREAIEDRQVRVRRIRQSDGGRGSATGMTEIAALQSEIDQFTSARSTAEAEAASAAEAWRDAETLLRAAIDFARASGATIPAPLASEGK